MAPLVKKILFPLIALFLAIQSFYAVTMLAYYGLDDSPLLAFFVAWVLNMCITGVFALLVFSHPVERLLPEAYYRIQRPALLKKVYNLLKVETFRKFLLLTFWRSREQRKKYFTGTRAGFALLDTQSRKSEFGHLLPFVLLTVASVYIFAEDNIWVPVFIFGWNVIGNLYPILLQRYHRLRLGRIVGRFR